VAEPVTYPGARRPHRRYRVDAHGVSIATYEWGDPLGPPIFFLHGGFDFAGTYDVFAPLIAEAGWRVISWDQRGHGDSDHTALYSWDADLRDALAVMDSVTTAPAPVLGHSKGGGLLIQLADALPHRVQVGINLDGLPSRRHAPDVNDHDRVKVTAGEYAAWLDHRRETILRQRRPGSLDDLARRRQQMNPRLPMSWLKYIATIGGRKDDDGWRWKLDPTMRFGGFGPFRPEWSMLRLSGLSMPFLGILGLEEDAMSWGTKPSDVAGYLPRQSQFVPLEGVGHFVHIEQPKQVAEVVLSFLETHTGHRAQVD
jgi:pimeloyl-ACP methyl ester carboxylesterase